MLRSLVGSEMCIRDRDRGLQLTSYFMNLVEFSKSMSSLRIGLSIVASARHLSVSRPSSRCVHEHTRQRAYHNKYSIQNISQSHQSIPTLPRNRRKPLKTSSDVFFRLSSEMFRMMKPVVHSTSLRCPTDVLNSVKHCLNKSRTSHTFSIVCCQQSVTAHRPFAIG